MAKVDPNRQYTPEEAAELKIQIDMFGFPVVDKARNMKDFFLVPPFSIIDTTARDWIDRKRRWHNLINDKGESRESTLFSGKETKSEVHEKAKSMNNGVSMLDPCLAEVCVKWFTAEGFKVLDPFAGDTVFGFVASYFDLKFTGIELREEQARLNNARIAAEDYNQSKYINDSSANMDKYIDDESQDFIFSCPPYLDLEVYSDLEEDLSTMSDEEFYKVYEEILSNTYRKLKSNRFACIVTSEVRDKKGSYRMLVQNTIEIMVRAGYKYYNDIILVNSVGTLPLRAGRFMSSTRKVGRRHQNVLIFYKGDNPNKDIKTVFPELITPNDYYN